ncbi:hypothetical protein [Streptomyces silaceus]|uniref:hypothetical protein n=1 Tax=Streptomyces silaceus TaxID=545123 RepID=UPI0006EB78D8|nr:hypothetical protein [Streptomyces silaceus]
MSELTYKSLKAQAAALQKKVLRNAEETQEAMKVLDEEATETAREADQMAGKSVDKDTVAESHELASTLRGLSDGFSTYVAKAQDTAGQAKAVGDEAAASHGAFQEAFDRSDVDGLENLDRDWLEQQ